MPFVESKVEFHDRHRRGGEPVHDGGWLIYPDGAACERSGLGMAQEPPADPHQRAKLVHRYWQVAAEAAVEQFTQLKKDLLQGTRLNHRNGDLPPPEEALKRLAALRDEARRLQKRAERAAAEVDRTTPAAVKNREAMLARNRQWCEQYAEQVKGIEL